MKKILFVAFILTVLAGCKKYENGPAFSLNSKTNRLKGDWKISEILYNDQPITFNEGAMNATYTFEKNNEYLVTGEAGQNFQSEKGTWEFDSKKEAILITLNSGVETYTISRLKKESLWLEQQSSSSTLLCKYIRK